MDVELAAFAEVLDGFRMIIVAFMQQSMTEIT